MKHKEEAKPQGSREFFEGLEAGIPICLGYFVVSFAFGLLAVQSGCTFAESALISATTLTSSGQFAGLTVMAGMGSLAEMALTQFVINARYMLMSVSLSQKAADDFSGIWRWILGFAVTDEIYAVAIQRPGQVGHRFFLGLAVLPYFGWLLGTVAGAFLGNVLPEILTNALGVALYGMFIAVVVPKAVEDSRVLLAALAAAGISAAFYYVPALSGVGSGFSIIISAVAASAACAARFPVNEEV